MTYINAVSIKASKTGHALKQPKTVAWNWEVWHHANHHQIDKSQVFNNTVTLKYANKNYALLNFMPHALKPHIYSDKYRVVTLKKHKHKHGKLSVGHLPE